MNDATNIYRNMPYEVVRLIEFIASQRGDSTLKISGSATLLEIAKVINDQRLAAERALTIISAVKATTATKPAIKLQ